MTWNLVILFPGSFLRLPRVKLCKECQLLSGYLYELGEPEVRVVYDLVVYFAFHLRLKNQGK